MADAEDGSGGAAVAIASPAQEEAQVPSASAEPSNAAALPCDQADDKGPEVGSGADEGETGPFHVAESIAFEPEVEAAIAEIFPSDDPLDDPKFDTVDYINTLFPNEQSLTKLDDFVKRLKKKIWKIDNDIQGSIRGQTRSGQDGGQALQDAQVGMTELFSRIRDIREKAELSEKMVQEITRDIKSLDYAKKNLTSSITTLNHLKMLVGGVDSLRTLVKQRQYRDCANLLAAVLNVMEHFEQYIEIAKVKELSQRINDIKHQVSHQITDEFQEAFSRPEPDPAVSDLGKLAEACLVVDVLGAAEKDKLISWFVKLQLRDYRAQFNPKKGAEWLDKIDRRFAWFVRFREQYREHCDGIFPKEWYIEEVIAERFCDQTREELKGLLVERREELDVKLLLHALDKSTGFERKLAKYFPSREYETVEERDKAANPDDKSVDAIAAKYQAYRQQNEPAPEPKQRLKPSKFIATITSVFEDYMDVYVQAQEATLETMMDTFLKQFKTDGVGNADGNEEDTAQTLESCGDMFNFFRNSIVQCKKLGSQKAIFDLYIVFKKYLATYSKKILNDNLPKSSMLASIILKDGDIKLSTEEQLVSCCILNTAEYCLEMTEKFEEKMKELVPEALADQVSLMEEQDSFHEVIMNTMQLLVRALETLCEPGLAIMAKTKWETVEEVGDTSAYVSQIGKHIMQFVPFVRSSMDQKSRKYFTNFCMKFVNSFIPRVVTSLFKCKHVSTVGAEQLLLDMQSMRMVLLELPSCASAVARKAPPSFTRKVSTGMSKAEMVLKVVMSPHDPANMFVEDYLKLIGEDDGLSGFQKILDMKGLKKAEQNALVEAYNTMAPASTETEKLTKKGAKEESETQGRGKPKSAQKLARLLARFQ